MSAGLATIGALVTAWTGHGVAQLSGSPGSTSSPATVSAGSLREMLTVVVVTAVAAVVVAVAKYVVTQRKRPLRS